MTDAEHKARWAKIDDPVEALGELLAHSQFVGDDPYYRDLSNALWEMAERAYAAAKARTVTVEDLKAGRVTLEDGETITITQTKEAPR